MPGWHATLFSATRAAAVTCAIMNPELRPASRARNGGKPGERGVGQLLDAPFADGGQLRQRDGQEVRRERHRLTVEVAAGKDRDMVLAAGEDKRVVGDRVHLDGTTFASDVFEHVAHCAVHLGCAAHAVRVLHPHVSRPVGLPDRGPAHQQPQVGGRGARCPRCSRSACTRGSNAVSVPRSASVESAATRSARRTRRRASRARQGEQRGHRLRAVDEGEPLLRSERERRETGAAQSIRCGLRDPAVDANLSTEAEQGKRQSEPAARDLRLRRPSLGSVRPAALRH